MSKLKNILASAAIVLNGVLTFANADLWQEAAEKRRSIGATYEMQAAEQEKKAKAIESEHAKSSLEKNLLSKLSAHYSRAAQLEELAYNEYSLGIVDLSKSAIKSGKDKQNNPFNFLIYDSCRKAAAYWDYSAKTLEILSQVQLENAGDLEDKAFKNEQERLANINKTGNNVYQAAYASLQAYSSYLAAVSNIERFAALKVSSSPKDDNGKSRTSVLREFAYGMLQQSQELYNLAAGYFEAAGNLGMKIAAESQEVSCIEQLAQRQSQKQVNKK